MITSGCAGRSTAPPPCTRALAVPFTPAAASVATREIRAPRRAGPALVYGVGWLTDTFRREVDDALVTGIRFTFTPTPVFR